MNFWSKLFKKNEEDFTEAAGSNVDMDEDQWRRLSGDSSRDLSPISQKRIRETAYYLWRTNLLANRMIELPVAYILAEGVSLTVENEDAQNWLNAFWNDPINLMDIRLVEKVRELALYGEQCWPAFANDINGHVRLGYLDPELIETVVKDPDNSTQPIGVITKKNKKGIARRFKVIINGPENCFSPRTQEIRDSFEDGECFYFCVNKVSNASRGSSDLLAAADWVDGYDQFLFGELERSNFARAFIWDIEMVGATQKEVEDRAKNFQAPAPGSARVHNEREKWRTVSPTLNSTDTEVTGRMFRNHALGGSTIPEHWFGGGGDVNRATASEMGDPTVKIFSMRQQMIKYMLEEVGKYVISRRLDPSGASSFDPEDPDPELLPQANFPEMTAKDTTSYAAALPQVVMAVGAAVDRGFITKATAVQIIETVSGRLGVTFDAKEELDAVLKEMTDKQHEDTYSASPEDLENGSGQEAQ
jgi:ribulose bisphosphate carboxylase small subunit